MSRADERTIEEARRIVRRSCIAPAEFPTMRRAALALLANNRTLTFDDHLVLRFARGLYGRHDWHEAAPRPRVRTPFCDEVEELERQVAEAKGEYESAHEALWAAGRRWARLVGQRGYAGFGVWLNGLLPPPEQKTTIPAGKDWSVKVSKPADPAAVAGAEADIERAVQRRREAEEKLGSLTSKLNAAKTRRSRWRATETTS